MAEPKAITKTPSKRTFQRRKQLEQDIEHITKEMYRRNKELADTNKTLSLLRIVDSLALEPHISFSQICQQITDSVTNITNYPLAGLLVRTAHVDDQLTLLGFSAQASPGLAARLKKLAPFHVDLDHDWFNSQQNGRLISLDGMDVPAIAQFLKCSESEVEHLYKHLPLQSVYIVKLRVRRHLLGILAVGFFSPAEEVSDSEKLILDRLSNAVGVALDNKLLFEENGRVLRQLKVSNSKLMNLDEAKDDFISMASHQLRTPLTSIKGYLSMVVEGDAGEITPTQRVMLNQAFSSCQRMVYIISDLLNVSRLRTGKFVIEGSLINLADIVQQEANQLKEFAKAKSIQIDFDKPKHFPELFIDETKTRQVIMNYIDNAIYYTKTGGRVKVSLKDAGPVIELRVQDNGIGVPRSEQHHLFTKFYRASNARKARPDGTGLGLYMAKKVVIAQGGAVIFESQEGKGSTFGFVINKAKLAKLQASDNPAVI